MTRAGRVVGAIVIAAASVGLFAGCAAPDVADDPDAPAVSGLAGDDTGTERDDTDAAGTVDEDLYVDVPEECRKAFPLAFGPADIADVELQPSDWPAPPDGATLCITAGTIGGATETASYAITTSIDDVFAHYEPALASYAPVRTSGADNGTGYATLTGGDAAFGFQIRESEGGFVLAFGRDDSGS